MSYRTNDNRQSKDTEKVSNALSKVQGEMGVFVVDKEGYNYKYLTLAKMLEVILPIAGKHNLSIVQLPSVHAVEDSPWVTVVTRLGCEEQYIENTFSFPMILPTKKTDTDIMSMGSTISYMRRFALQSILGIAGADVDPEERQKNDIENSSERKNPNATGLK